jgi:hypothetical protein
MMGKYKLFLLLFISAAFFSMGSNVMADYEKNDLKIAEETGQLVVAKEAKPQESAQNPCMTKNACNPCAAKNACNPCATNPCGVKNACNPCAVNPCGVKNACNPCASKTQVKPIRSERITSLDEAVRYGEKLWKDTKLGTSGLSCDTCHAGGNTYTKTALMPYPHFVKMPNDVVTLDQMINFCMINPMKGKPLPYNSKEMTALSAYFQNVSLKEIESTLGAPSVNPCGSNPCNPCAAKNACNPCSGR